MEVEVKKLTENVFGPVSLFFTFELWAIYPILWIWRQILGFFV